MNAPETMTEIARRVAAAHGLPGATALRAAIHTRKFNHARQEVYATIYATGRYSMPQIAAYFGREYSTVWAAIQVYARRTPGYAWPARRPVSSVILRELAQGQTTIAAIVRATGLEGELVSGTLARFARRGLVVRVSHKPVVWALAEAA